MVIAVLAVAGVNPLAHAGDQPIVYNHNVHVENARVECVKCHAGVLSRARAGLPPDVFCAACHAQPRGDSPEEARLIELLASGVPLAWRPVTHVAPFVHFSHQRHVAIADIDCTVCHGAMAERVKPPEKPAIDFTGRAGMLRCIACHERSGSPYAGTSCVNCHR